MRWHSPCPHFSTMPRLDPEMVQEITERLILHWNYRGYSSLPEELSACGEHVHELYLKYNNLTCLVKEIKNKFYKL